MTTGVAVALCGLFTVGVPGGILSPALHGLSAWGDALPASKTVDIDVVGADLATVINLLQRQTGVEFLIQDTGRPFGKVTVGLAHASFDKALRTIAQSANATVQRNQDGVYVIRPAAGNDGGSADNSAGGSSSPVSDTAQTVAAPPAAPQAEMHWQKLVLLHAIPNDVLKIMHWDKDLREIEPFQGVQSPEQRPQITNTNAQGVVALPAYYGAPSVPLGRGDSGSGVANRSVDPSEQAQQFPGPPTITGPGFGRGGRFGNGNNNPNSPGLINTGNDPFQAANGNGQQQNALPEGVDRIYALQGDNSLFIEATPEGFSRVRDIVKNLDIAPRQVQIKVEFVTASVTDVNAFGINFSLVPVPGVEVSNNQGDQANQTPQTYVQVATGNIVAQLFSTLLRSHGKVVQAPLITTTNNVTANINVATQIPFVTTTNVTSGTGTVSNTQQSFLTINTGLTVQARINYDDTITLNLSPRISDISGAPSITGGAPPTVQQTLSTLRTVRNGETMVLGGLVRKSEIHQSEPHPVSG